jgi:deazaflavin-dependent oxidoreductase (nitroreductase family)
MDLMSSWNDAVITEFRDSKGETNRWGPKLVVMHTIGAKSGEERLAPVVGFRTADGWNVVASKGGAPENPSWYHNIVANPSFDLEALTDGEIETVSVTARELDGAEYEAAWRAVVEEAPSFAEYPTKAGRHIPVFALTRV